MPSRQSFQRLTWRKESSESNFSVKSNKHDPLRRKMPSFKQVKCKPNWFQETELTERASDHRVWSGTVGILQRGLLASSQQ